jgi:adenine-specific DNA-methyltransferase
MDYTCRYTADERPTLFYAIKNPKTGEDVWPKRTRIWAFSKEAHLRNEMEKRIWWGADGNAGVPALKNFISEIKQGMMPMSLLKHEVVGNTDEATKELREFFPELKFTPKPVRLIKHLCLIANLGPADLVLDFFAGSGTTAQAVLEQAAHSPVRPVFLMVQLPEPTDLKGLSTVAEITKERVRLVIKKLNAEDGGKLKLDSGVKPDRGFKVFKLQSSNFKAWNAEQPKDDVELAKQLSLHVDHLVAGRTQEDVLYELLLKSGFPLGTKVEKITLAGKSIFAVADGAMLICLEKELTPEVIKAMAEKKPERVVCLDAGFADNDQLKTNAVQTMKSKGVTKFQTV